VGRSTLTHFIHATMYHGSREGGETTFPTLMFVLSQTTTHEEEGFRKFPSPMKDNTRSASSGQHRPTPGTVRCMVYANNRQ